MSNVAALTKGRDMSLGDGVYLERRPEREPVFEEYLRAVLARLPRPKSHKRRMRRFVALTGAHELRLQELPDLAVADDFTGTCARMRREGFTDKLLGRAFAAVREASKRTLGLRHHDVQLMGGWALMQGTIAEMATGEGKTLVATLAACTAAAAGAGVHVITVNDYLAERDAEENAPLFAFFGLSVGKVTQGMQPGERRDQYASDVVYVSNKEIVFDYLKDRIATGPALASHYQLRRLYGGGSAPAMILRGLHMAIVDEADSILIDEARTPLIISETVNEERGGALYREALSLAQELVRGRHFELGPQREIWLTTAGEEAVREMTDDWPGVWGSVVWRNELVQKALMAQHCYHRDQHYIVQEGKVEIVDEFSGRVMPDRSWENGLHQMIEAKEGCEITGRRKTLSRMTYQRFLGRYLLLAGMTGTAAEVAPELKRVYDLDVVTIPTRLPCARKRHADRCWMTAAARWQAVVERARVLQEAGSAILIGTRSVEASEELSRCLAAQEIEHVVLNARNDREEATIVARAGQAGRITIATNMAGRGTDIKPADDVLGRGGLHVILTEFHESARIDRQLFGRSARQGQPGNVEAMVSLEDELFVRHAPRLSRWAGRFFARRSTLPNWCVRLLVNVAQRRAESRNRRVRMATLKHDRKLHSLLAFAGTPN